MNFRKVWLSNRERQRYWQTVPLSTLVWLSVTAFLAFSSVGLATDLSEGLRQPYGWVLVRAVVFASAGALCFAVILRKPGARYVVGLAVVLLFSVLLNLRLTPAASSVLMKPEFGYVRQRLGTDGSLFSIAATLGWILLVILAGTQGVRHVRMRTELDLAEQLQQTLAPPLSVRHGGYEIYGRSVPSSQMGGDLLDAVSHDGTLACYVGDVAGHGIQAGVFMGMVKSSARTVLLRPGRLEGLLADLNKVLFEVKAGSPTYVTFACMRCRDDGKIEYSVAGQGPILHYHSRSKTVSHLSMEQFPVGLFAGPKFESKLVEVESGDILALLTDGLPEVADRNDEQFGLSRIGEIIAQNAGADLQVLAETLFAGVRRFGNQNDDETLLLVRAISGA